jgi:hypothetical protein
MQCGIDSDCGSDESCNPNYSPNLCRPKRENGYWPCVDDSQCFSDRCVDTTRTCESKKQNGSSCFRVKNAYLVDASGSTAGRRRVVCHDLTSMH